MARRNTKIQSYTAKGGLKFTTKAILATVGLIPMGLRGVHMFSDQYKFTRAILNEAPGRLISGQGEPHDMIIVKGRDLAKALEL